MKDRILIFKCHRRKIRRYKNFGGRDEKYIMNSLLEKLDLKCCHRIIMEMTVSCSMVFHCTDNKMESLSMVVLTALYLYILHFYICSFFHLLSTFPLTMSSLQFSDYVKLGFLLQCGHWLLSFSRSFFPPIFVWFSTNFILFKGHLLKDHSITVTPTLSLCLPFSCFVSKYLALTEPC